MLQSKPVSFLAATKINLKQERPNKDAIKDSKVTSLMVGSHLDMISEKSSEYRPSIRSISLSKSKLSKPKSNGSINF